MPPPADDNTRIAKNTLFLYGRMIVLTLVNLVTVRVTLNALGIEDYGIYNVVASFVALLGILNGTLTASTQRFLSFHLGKRDYAAYSRTFSLLLIGFAVIAAVIVGLGEIAGIFAFDGFLKIPANRLWAAKWIFQTSLATFVVSLLTIPFTSSIVSNERMSAFAYISIADGVMKLGLVYLLLAVSTDRLILYGVLTLTEATIILLLYIIYCKRNFKYCRLMWIWDKGVFRELTAYTGWNMFGSISGVLISQGQNVLLNIFFGPVINAAKGIADKIYAVIFSLSANFFMAISPQIVKSYAAGDSDRMRQLSLKASKFSFLLLYLGCFPMILGMEYILRLWLGPDGTSEDMTGFGRLVLIQAVITALEPPITQMINATGDVKAYQIKVGVFTLLYLPLAWGALRLGGSPLTTMWVLIGLYTCVMGIRLWQAHIQVGLSFKRYARMVVLPIAAVTLVSVPVYIGLSLVTFTSLWRNLLFTCGCGLAAALLIVWTAGLDRSERGYALSTVKSKMHLGR